MPPLFSAPLPGRHEQEETGTVMKPALSSKVILYNDEEHTYDYVVEMLTKVCKLSREAAFRCAVEVDLTGRTIVFYGTPGACGDVCAQILNYGPDHRLLRSHASMQAEVQTH
jgi:ATP-dependent Clp protease adaptor protein ClpS